MARNIKQTKELLIAALSIFAATAAAKANGGSISRTKALSIVFENAGTAWTAVAGAGEVPAEIADLDEAELEELMQATLESQAWADTPLHREIVKSVFDSIGSGLQTVRLILQTQQPE